MRHMPDTPTPQLSSDHNGLALFSFVCAILWPLTITAMARINSAANVAGSGSTATSSSDPAYMLLDCGFLVLPIAGIIAGVIGLYRAIRRPRVRKSLWLALPGLLLGCL